MDNPFSCTGIVKGDAFCDRQTEQTELLNFIKASQNVFLPLYQKVTDSRHRFFQY